jgi:predicted nuclease with TOPRIM domain
MADEPENLRLIYLRRIDAKVDGLGAELREVRDRLTAVEIGLAGIRRDIGGLAETDARLQASVDRLRDEMTRVNRRLDISDQPQG